MQGGTVHRGCTSMPSLLHAYPQPMTDLNLDGRDDRVPVLKASVNAASVALFVLRRDV